ncbi:hypothetical protein [uncultured Methylobacterium sp.]|uniref:DUF1843 domain-containing protein n=1 Tax=uncultured Methylobacterium sp. TaxID=157278 RepID=UPI002613E385|nr:hypothetical protein [uncultured Methylobacterium sp.]
MSKKDEILQTIRVSRMVYDPPIRETIAINDLDHMKTVLKEAKAIQKEQSRAIDRLEKAICKLSQSGR